MTTMRTQQIEVAAGVIDFGVGQPAMDILPLAELREAAAHRFAQGDPAFLQYGPEEGEGYFNHALAQFLTTEYARTSGGAPVGAEQLFISNGVSQALDLICTLYTQPGDLIFVEEPTYFLVYRIFRDHGLQIKPIPLTAQGMDLDLLEERLQRERPTLVYTIPTFQNPANVTMPQAQRERLISFSQTYGFTLLADEVYQLLYYHEPPPRPFADYVQEAPVLSLGSFSKILAPGLRLGWVQAAPAVVNRLVESGIVQSGGGLNPMSTGVARSALELGLQQQYVQKLRVLFAERIAAMDGALRRTMPAFVDFRTPTGGYFYWLRLPETVDTNDLLPLAEAHKVGFRPGNKFSSTEALRNCLRLSFSYYDSAALVEGVERLGAVLAEAA
ncbi:MAG: PLP-dependent aminotransferase family protein [Caldilineaceae bacterium]|nr:PLP-dependent aminotransferase family protein [Caldilineaceae bacterium]